MRFSLVFFIVIPLLELYLLFLVAEEIGGLATFALVLLTAAVGLSVLRRQGFQRLRRIDEQIRRGQSPGKEIFKGMLLSFAGVLLILPGVMSDTIGCILLIPVVRGLLAERLLRSGNVTFMGTMGGWGFGGRPGAGGDIIEGEVVDRDDAGRYDPLDHTDRERD